jgi:hypothetical protein
MRDRITLTKYNGFLHYLDWSLHSFSSIKLFYEFLLLISVIKLIKKRIKTLGWPAWPERESLLGRFGQPVSSPGCTFSYNYLRTTSTTHCREKICFHSFRKFIKSLAKMWNKSNGLINTLCNDIKIEKTSEVFQKNSKLQKTIKNNLIILYVGLSIIFSIHIIFES